MEKMYIARTAAYFEPDEDDLYVPDLWTWSEDPDDKDFEGDVYELNDEAASELVWWLRCQKMNEWQRRNCFIPDNRRPEEVWESLVEQSVIYKKEEEL